MTFESSTSRLSEEQIMNAACNAADALDATRVSEMRPEGWHATTIFDGDAGLIRFGRLVEEAVLARLIPSETESINAAPQGTEGYGLCDDNLGNVPAAAAPFSTDKQDEGRCDICKAEIDEFNAGVEAWRAGVAFHDLPDMPMDQNGVGWVWAAWNGKTFAPSHAAPVGPYKVGEPEDEDGSSTVLNSYGVSMTADEIVALLNTYSKLAVADLSQLIPSATASSEWNDAIWAAISECQRLEQRGKDNHLDSWMGNAMEAIGKLTRSPESRTKETP
jgi:hypothetical protein